MTIVLNPLHSSEWRSQNFVTNSKDSIILEDSISKRNSLNIAHSGHFPQETDGLRCPHCADLFRNPVILPCGHSLCGHCSAQLLTEQREISSIKSQSWQGSHSSKIRMGTKTLSVLRPATSSNSQMTHADLKQQCTPLRQSVKTPSSLSRRSKPRSGIFKNLFVGSVACGSIERLVEEDSEFTNPEAKSAPKSKPLSVASGNLTNPGLAKPTRPAYKSPKCPVCGAGPRMILPIRNLVLDQLTHSLKQFEKQNATISRNEASFSPTFSANHAEKTSISSGSSGFEDVPTQAEPPRDAARSRNEECRRSPKAMPAPVVKKLADTISEDEDDVCLLKSCKVAIFGAPKTGKTQLASTQKLNSLLFGQINEADVDQSKESGSEEECSRTSIMDELKAKYRLCILDNNDLAQDARDADAIVLTYASNDKSSLDMLKSCIVPEIRLRRADDLPMVLVATKCDLKASTTTPHSNKSRPRNGSGNAQLVPACEGEALAQDLGCPFLEVSAKTNFNVNTIFLQLIQMIDRRESA